MKKYGKYLKWFGAGVLLGVVSLKPASWLDGLQILTAGKASSVGAAKYFPSLVSLYLLVTSIYAFCKTTTNGMSLAKKAHDYTRDLMLKPAIGLLGLLAGMTIVVLCLHKVDDVRAGLSALLIFTSLLACTFLVAGALVKLPDTQDQIDPKSKKRYQTVARITAALVFVVSATGLYDTLSALTTPSPGSDTTLTQQRS
jgi:heme A synthase